ncbi:MAG: carboxypeptidase-like regulatory domain-containing protein [Leptothrix sp. (in: b-proteobacteria)]
MHTTLIRLSRILASGSARSRAACLAIGLSAVLAACGGLQKDPVVISGTVTDTSALPVAGVKIALGTTTGEQSVTTAADGSYKISVNVAALPKDLTIPLAVTFSKATYFTRLYKSNSTDLGTLDAGKKFTLNVANFRALTAQELADPAGAVLTRMGDGQTSGGSNLTLQAPLPSPLPAGGVSRVTIPLGSINPAITAQNNTTVVSPTDYTGLTVSITFRGLDGCSSLVRVFQGGIQGNTSVLPLDMTFSEDNSSSTASFRPSDSAGAFTTMTFFVPFTGTNPPAQLIDTTNGPLSVAVTAGQCSTDGLDDFEFIDVRGVLNLAVAPV